MQILVTILEQREDSKVLNHLHKSNLSTIMSQKLLKLNKQLATTTYEAEIQLLPDIFCDISLLNEFNIVSLILASLKEY